MNPWKFILATLAIFTAGIVTGGLLVGYGVRQQARWLPRPNNPAPRQPGNVNASPVVNREAPRNNPNVPPQFRQARVLTEDFLKKLDGEVHLTPDQHERISQIMVEGQQRNKEVMDRITPELRREMMETQRRIRELLTEDQRPRFEELMKQRSPKRSDEPGKMHRQQPPFEDRSTQALPVPVPPNKP